MEAEPLFHRLLMDEKYYRQSGGGVTFSGGEPSIHAEFLLELLPKLHQQRIHTALETCGFCEEERFVRLASQCDLLLFDVKHMDAARHREGCGVDNRHILSNLERAARITDVIIRIPLIPSFNDDQENLLQTAKLASRLNIGHMQLLPFHRLGTHKYTELDRSYAYAGEQPLDAERVAQTAEWLAQESGLRVTVG